MLRLAALVLDRWVAADDNDWYALVMSEWGLSQPEAKRAVRWALGVVDLSPKTSRDYAEVRQGIRKGDLAWWDQLV